MARSITRTKAAETIASVGIRDGLDGDNSDGGDAVDAVSGECGVLGFR